MTDLRREMKDGSTYDSSKKIELSDDALEKIQGGVWDYATTSILQQEWENDFATGTPAIWRENGVIDHWGIIMSYTYTGNQILSFDLDLVYENMFVYGVPAGEVLVDFKCNKCIR